MTMSQTTYNDIIIEEISNSGGTIIFVKENVIIASNISESEYRSLLNSSYINKIDILPLKDYSVIETVNNNTT